MAKKRNFENCQICNNPFIFNDKYGMYYCEHCKFGGGLKKFGELLSKKNFNEVSNG
jgi:ribosomal protein L37AE/L43A